MHKKQRFEWVDIARGAGVCFVIFTHLRTFPIVDLAIRSWIIPIFLMLSGFLYSKKPEFRPFVVTKAKRLLVPSIVFVLLGAAIEIVKTGWSSDFLANLFFWYGIVPYNNPVWFFIVLFEVYVIEFAFNGFRTTTFKKAILALGFFVVGLCTFNVFLPFGLDRAIVAAGFFSVGEVLRDVLDHHGNDLHDRRWKSISFIIFWLVVLIVFGVVLNDYTVSFYRFDFGNYIFFVISGIAGAMALIDICILAERAKGVGFFKLAGTNSVFIIGTHYVFAKLFVRIAKHFGYFQTLPYFFAAILFTLLLVKAYEPICAFLDRRAPWITGKMK